MCLTGLECTLPRQQHRLHAARANVHGWDHGCNSRCAERSCSALTLITSKLCTIQPIRLSDQYALSPEDWDMHLFSMSTSVARA